MNIEVTRINSGIKQNPSEYVKTVNDDYYYKLGEIVKCIAENSASKPVILLSGPSGSGKTTTAFIIAKMLGEMGKKTHTLSMDNYFCPLSSREKELASLGKMDLESPLRIDSQLLNSQIERIEKCETVEIPRYNFGESTRERGRLFSRKPDEMVIFEGIHALNPSVITVPDKKICKIYVSVRSRITCGDIILHPSKIRLMRRMVRDRNFRKRDLTETMNMFKSVENGENKYIMPFKHRSDYDVDTFFAYELSVYRNSLINDLKEMSQIPELADVTEVMENLEPLDASYVTPDSLICEFIGNGEFKY